MRYARLVVCATVLCVTAALGCLGMWAVTPSPVPSSTRFPRTIDPDSLTFAMPELKSRFRQFESAARKVAASNFQHQTYQLSGNRLTAVWTTEADFERLKFQFDGRRAVPKTMHRLSH
jgi:hypothetical protein